MLVNRGDNVCLYFLSFHLLSQLSQTLSCIHFGQSWGRSLKLKRKSQSNAVLEDKYSPIFIIRIEIKKFANTNVCRMFIKHALPGREINFFSDGHLAPGFSKVVANSKNVGPHF